jgi:streptogramin lyase
MSSRSRTTLALLAFLIASGTSARSAEPARSVLQVTTIQCLSDLHRVPELRVLRMNDRNLPHAFLHYTPSGAVLFDGTPHKMGLGVYRFNLNVLPANYEIYAESKSCFGQMMAIVLAHHPRKIALALGRNAWNMLFDHDHAGLAGAIDMPGAELRLVASDDERESRAVQIQQGAFYVDSLQRARWLLRVSAGCCASADFPIDLSGVRAGDYATVALKVPDVLTRLHYRGPLFSDPTVVAASGRAAWYANSGRQSIGRVTLDGSHNEVSLPGEGNARLIVPDGQDGAWFTRSRQHGLWHVNDQLVLESIGVPGTTKTVIEDLFPQRDGSVLVVAVDGNRKSLYRVTLTNTLVDIDVPAAVNLGLAGVAADGSVWFNVNDKDHVARLDGNRVVVVDGETTAVAPDKKRVSSAIYYVTVPDGQPRRGELIGASGLSSGSYPRYSPMEIVDDGRGGAWITNCSKDNVEHVSGAGGTEQSFAAAGCPVDPVADRDGGVWFLRYRPQMIVHVDRSGTLKEYSVSNAGANVGNLSVDDEGDVWFPEAAVNRIGLVRNGTIKEIDLGNSGATPGFTVIP